MLKERTRVVGLLGTYHGMNQQKSDLLEMVELAEAEGDEALVNDSISALQALADTIARLELESLLSGEADANDCFLEVHAGAGGTESQDWASMLLRMYMRWADQHGYKTELMDETEGEEAGIKSATIKVSGHNAYGWLKTENGVHRLVRVSPFDSAGRRHTSFSGVAVSPQIDDNIEIEILDKDLRVDTYRASGAGGQHVNKTDSAVRFTHLPTGIVVASQTNRSQHKNREECMRLLRGKLYDLELKKREDATNAMNAQKTDNAWGHQIRSYVLYPYQMVKDQRTAVETSDSAGVLDGDIDKFLSAALAQRVKGLSEKV